jgi:hypothetical protein
MKNKVRGQIDHSSILCREIKMIWDLYYENPTSHDCVLPKFP